MKYLAILAAVIIAGCDARSAPPRVGSAPTPHLPTYEELVNYPVDCSKSEEQLFELRNIQRFKNFNSDIDELNEADRAYNSRLKATIWFYEYGCPQ